MFIWLSGHFNLKIRTFYYISFAFFLYACRFRQWRRRLLLLRSLNYLDNPHQAMIVFFLRLLPAVIQLGLQLRDWRAASFSPSLWGRVEWRRRLKLSCCSSVHSSVSLCVQERVILRGEVLPNFVGPASCFHRFYCLHTIHPEAIQSLFLRLFCGHLNFLTNIKILASPLLLKGWIPVSFCIFLIGVDLIAPVMTRSA